MEWPARSVTCGGAGPCWVLPQRCPRDGATGRDSRKREKRKQEGGSQGPRGLELGKLGLTVGRPGGMRTVSPEPGHPAAVADLRR